MCEKTSICTEPQSSQPSGKPDCPTPARPFVRYPNVGTPSGVNNSRASGDLPIRSEHPVEEGEHIVALHGPTHGRQGDEENPAVAGRRESRVQHRDDPPVGGGPDEAADALREQGGGPRQVDQLEGLASGALPTGLEQWVVGTAEREAVHRHEAERTPGDVDSLPEPERREEARRLVL